MKRLILGGVFAILLGVGVVYAQTSVPSATERDHVLAKLDISRDGRTVTIRGIASGDTRVCVAPATHTFGPTRCFTVEDIRRGAVTRR